MKSLSREECNLRNSSGAFTIDATKPKINHNVQIMRQYIIADLIKYALLYSFIEL